MQSEVHGSPTASVPGLFNSPVAQVAQQQTSTERPVSATPAVLQSKKISQVIVGRIDQSITKGVPVVEIQNPKLAFPAGIYVDQIDKYFKIDNILLALVYRPSHNLFGFPLTPEHYTFAGILTAEQGEKKWSKLAEIKELNGSIGEYVNNPYYLMVKDLQLRLSVVDDNGGGSGEGYLKVFALSETGDWQQLEQCYYFGLGVEGDYLAFSTQLAKHKPEPMDSCKDVTMISI